MRLLLVVCLALAITGCSDVTATAQKENVLHTQSGEATFYARSFQGDPTASGQKFDNRKAMAAHRSFPFGTVARVTNPENGTSVQVVIVDRGPYGKNRREGAVIDLSRAAAAQLGMLREGQIPVRIEVLQWGNGERNSKLGTESN
jgi:rare lipoprotein A